MTRKTLLSTLLVSALSVALPATAQVSATDANKLKGELTPFGAEKAGNKDGSIPAWTGGYTKPIPGDKPGGRRGDPFKDEKPLYSITAKNMDQYADKLTDGVKALFKKFPDTYRIDVYKTHRTAAAPQWVYDNTLRNATSAKIENGTPSGIHGGIPFPLPKDGEQVMWNHILRWNGEALRYLGNWYVISADGKATLVSDTENDQQFPYYYKDQNAEQFEKSDRSYWLVRITNVGPALRAGEALLARETIDFSKLGTWVYLTGQRRVRKLPNACCDTPTPAASGVMSFDEIDTWTGRMDRFDWKIVGKKEMLIPYNNNKFMQPKTDAEVITKHHYNPDHMRWEDHRVWVVEATLKKGQRHQAARSRYYCDEDTWICVLGDRWDANGQLWKTLWTQVFVAPDLPGVAIGSFGFNDLQANNGFMGVLVNSKPSQVAVTPRRPDSYFSADALAGDGVR